MMKRVAAVFLVVLLYGVLWDQRYDTGRGVEWRHLPVLKQEVGETGPTEKPHFSENFVNQAQPGVMCHVSSIAPAGDRRLICTWYAGSQEGARDVAIFRAFFDEQQGRWSLPAVLVDRHSCSRELRRFVKKVGNALVFRDGGGRLWLFYASMAYGGWSAASLNYKVSRDGGETWSDSRKLLLSPFFNLTNNVKNQGVIISGEAFLLPVYHEFLHKFSQMVFIRTKEGSLSYDIRKMTRSGKAIQPALVRGGGQELAAFFRNADGTGKHYILTAQSPDAGRTWSDLTATPLPNPNAGFDMIALGDGAYLGAVNNTFQDRSNLSLVVSRDGGKTWKTLKVLEEAPGKEFSYPFLLRRGQAYHLTYTYERKQIKHLVFNDAWLKELPAYGN